jgi:hypothetical protein
MIEAEAIIRLQRSFRGEGDPMGNALYVRRLRSGRRGCAWSLGRVGLISEFARLTSGPSLTLYGHLQKGRTQHLADEGLRNMNAAPRTSVQAWTFA